MILFKRDKIRFIDQRNIMLEGEDSEGKFYLYVDKSTYDQACILNSRYQGDVVKLGCSLGLNDVAIALAQTFAISVPAPISILGVFLGMIDFEYDQDFEVMCGVLSQLSMCIAFNEYTKIPAEARTTIQFNKAYLEGYQEMWVDVQNYYCDSVALDDALVKKIIEAIGTIGFTSDTYSRDTSFDDSKEEGTASTIIDESKGDVWKDPFAGLSEELEAAWSTIDTKAEEEEDESALEEKIENMSEDDAISFLMQKMGGMKNA